MRISEAPITDYRRGDIIFVENPNMDEKHKNHVVHGNHPAVIVQNQMGNEHSPNLIIAYLTSKIKRLEMKTHVLITWYDGLKPSIIQTEHLATIDKNMVLGLITHLRNEDMIRLDHALMASLGLER